MIQTLSKNWWLLALCGVLDAIVSVLYFDHAGHGFHMLTDIVLLGRLTLAAGICAVAAGLWKSARGSDRLLVLNGLALGALGLILNGIAGFKIAFLTIALLVVVMATSVGVLELLIARAARRHDAEEWLLRLAGAVSIGFALVFLALGFRWIAPQPGSPALTFLWLGAYFGFTAICMLGLALRSRSSPTEALPPLGTPSPAH